MGDKYTVLTDAGKDGKVKIKRASDGKVSRCKLSWLEQLTETEWVAKNNTKAIRLDGLEWATEG